MYMIIYERKKKEWDEWIKNIIQSPLFNLSHIEKQCDVPPGILYKYLKGKRSITIEQMLKITNYINEVGGMLKHKMTDTRLPGGWGASVYHFDKLL